MADDAFSEWEALLAGSFLSQEVQDLCRLERGTQHEDCLTEKGCLSWSYFRRDAIVPPDIGMQLGVRCLCGGLTVILDCGKETLEQFEQAAERVKRCTSSCAAWWRQWEKGNDAHDATDAACTLMPEATARERSALELLMRGDACGSFVAFQVLISELEQSMMSIFRHRTDTACPV